MIDTTYPTNAGMNQVDFNSIFAPDTILPSQHKDMRQGSAEKAGERRLMLAVLEQAIADAMTKDARRRKLRLYFEAWDWIEHDCEHPFSFVNVCDFLDINADSLRKQLLEAKDGIAVDVPHLRIEAEGYAERLEVLAAGMHEPITGREAEAAE